MMMSGTEGACLMAILTHCSCLWRFRGSCMSVNGVDETKGFSFTPRGAHATGSRVAGLQRQACIATALLNLSLCMHLLGVYLLIMLITGTFYHLSLTFGCFMLISS